MADIHSDAITIETGSEELDDGYIDLFSDEGTPELQLSTTGDGAVTIYGVATKIQAVSA